MANAVVGPVAAPPARGVGEILSDAFSLYKTNAVLLIVTAAVAMAPVYVIKDAIVAASLAPAAVSGLEADSARLEELNRKMERAQARGASPEEIQAIAAEQMKVAMSSAQKGVGMLAGFGVMLLGLLLTIPLIALASYLAQAALTVVVADRARSGAMTWQQAWGVVMQNLGGLVITSILAAMGIAIGLLLCIVPGVVFSVFASLAVPVVLLEKKTGVAAIRRSIDLVKADWLRVVIVLVVFGVLSAVASWVGGLFIPSRFYFMHMLIGDLVSIAVLPIPIVGLVLLYQDIARARLNVPETQLAAQRDALLGTRA